MAKRKEDMDKWLLAHIDDPEAKGAKPHWTATLRALQGDKSLKGWFIKKMLTERDDAKDKEEEKPAEPAAVLIDELLAQWENEAGKSEKASVEIAELKAKVKRRDKDLEEFTQIIEGYQAKEKANEVPRA